VRGHFWLGLVREEHRHRLEAYAPLPVTIVARQRRPRPQLAAVYPAGLLLTATFAAVEARTIKSQLAEECPQHDLMLPHAPVFWLDPLPDSPPERDHV
jgi:hypothetical protein